MKIKFLAVIALMALMALSLSSCDGFEKTDGAPSPSNTVMISADSKVEEAKINEPFEIEVGIGHSGEIYATATLEISAPDCTIILPDGSSVEDRYVLEIPDYRDEKYAATPDKINFFETYSFIYTGTGDAGWIHFYLKGVTETKGGIEGHFESIYYSVSGETIHLTKTPPEKT